MKVLWPFGVALRGEASNHLMLRWLKTVVVSDEEKAHVDASGGDQEGERERTAVEVSKPNQTASKLGRLGLLQDESGGCPCIGQMMPGMEAARAWSAAFTRNVGRRASTPPAGAGVGAGRR
jgi:hypothetical protein